MEIQNLLWVWSGQSFFTSRCFNKSPFSFYVFVILNPNQISDIVVGQEDNSMSAKEVLLRWAQRTTSRYPHVAVKDFTSSWRDGLAFCSIIHRNRWESFMSIKDHSINILDSRPDLLDWKAAEGRRIRERIDLAFYIMEKEFGVTRLLDPEGEKK